MSFFRAIINKLKGSAPQQSRAPMETSQYIVIELHKFREMQAKFHRATQQVALLNGKIRHLLIQYNR